MDGIRIGIKMPTELDLEALKRLVGRGFKIYLEDSGEDVWFAILPSGVRSCDFRSIRDLIEAFDRKPEGNSGG